MTDKADTVTVKICPDCNNRLDCSAVLLHSDQVNIVWVKCPFHSGGCPFQNKEPKLYPGDVVKVTGDGVERMMVVQSNGRTLLPFGGEA